MPGWRLFCLLLLVIWGCSSDPEPDPEPQAQPEPFLPQQVLFIGNSHTQNNEGIDFHVRGFLANTTVDYPTRVEKRTMGGYSLEDHLNDEITLNKLEETDWDIIVLQENTFVVVNDSPQAQASFQDFSFQIRDDKTRLYLFMTWAYEDDPSSYNILKEVYENIAPLINGTIVPVGTAFKAIQNEENLGFPLYNIDGVHCSPEGTFLAAAMFYAAIYDKDPTENNYSAALDADTANFLKIKAKEILASN